jgi:hypothetical protein
VVYQVSVVCFRDRIVMAKSGRNPHKSRVRSLMEVPLLSLPFFV